MFPYKKETNFDIVAFFLKKLESVKESLGTIRVPKFMLEGFNPVFRHLGVAMLTSSFKG